MGEKTMRNGEIDECVKKRVRANAKSIHPSYQLIDRSIHPSNPSKLESMENNQPKCHNNVSDSTALPHTHTHTHTT
jgi:hypothetical protein